MIIEGDVSDPKTWEPIEDESVQCCITSPPYWGLRAYGTPPAIWPDSIPLCDEHEWTSVAPRRQRNEKDVKNKESKQATNVGANIDLRETNFCSKCGAWRGELGLEPTPELYVKHIVHVFRFVWQKLRKDGTLWLNLGDSYWGGKGQSAQAWTTEHTDRETLQKPQHQITGKGETRPQDGKHDVLKPKDLCGIPWAVAKALQQPYYTGRIKREADRIWLAAIIDGEGCMFIHKRKVGQNNGQGYKRKSDSYGAGLEVANTHESIVKRCQEITGIGSICHQDKENKNKDRNLRLFRWNVRSNECRWVVREIYPYLVGKKHEARLLLGCPSSGQEAERAHLSLINLHNGLPALIDFPEPESLYEPGWYLRSDIIWYKKNPMPESVTDRPTKSHEYIFLLTKSAKYYYDQEAVKEDSVDPESFTGRRKRNAPTMAKYDLKNLKNAGSIQEDGTLTYGQIYPTRNLRSVWTITTKPYSGAHFATFPPEIPERCIRAGTSEKGACEKCGSPWERVTEKTTHFEGGSGKAGRSADEVGDKWKGKQYGKNILLGPVVDTKTLGWQPTCTCNAEIKPCIVLDPFAGSGTTLEIAERMGRKAIGIELNQKYIKDLIEPRMEKIAPLFAPSPEKGM